jgi:hypothetical protein
LEDVGDRNQYLAASRIIDTIVSCMYTPHRVAPISIRFGEASLNFGRDLIDKSFRWCHIDQYIVIVRFKHLLHRIEGDKGLAGRGWGDHKQAAPSINLI